MRRAKIILFAAVSVVIIGLFSFEVLAAVFVNINVGGKVLYATQDLGAKIFGIATSSQNNDAAWLNFSASGNSSTDDNIFTFNGGEQDEAKITANNNMTFSAENETRYVYLFVKNIGDLSIIPNLDIAQVQNVTITTQAYYFETDTQDDPFNIKETANDAPNFLSAMNGKYTNAFQDDATIGKNDVLCVKVAFTKNGTIPDGANYNIDVWLRADIIYNSNNILQVYQPANTTTWKKKGINATFKAEATKVDATDIGTLQTKLTNHNIAYGRDDYQTQAPVYRNIDLVNIDITTGEVVGRLSNPDYPFEWYGRNNLDVYTYYPDMYVRRWVDSNSEPHLAVSEDSFEHAVKIDAYYLATFEATIFSPVTDSNNNITNYTVAYNDNGIVPRSYVYDRTPLTSGSAQYLITNYGYTNPESKTLESTTQENMMKWTNNLTTAWQTAQAGNTNNDKVYANSAQGENWKQYVWNLLYLIKYADNNSQATVGKGNTYSYSAYNANGVQIKNKSGNVINSGYWQYYEAEKGSGAIGVYNASAIANQDGYNGAKMAYGFESNYSMTGHRQGLFANQFLTKDNHLLDGYVGTDGYTSVFCLGKCNPWGNVWEWIFGTAVLYDNTNSQLHAYVNFTDWDGKTQVQNSNWFMQTNNSGYSTNSSTLTGKGYTDLGYTLATSYNYYSHLGGGATGDADTTLKDLIGMPKAGDTTATATTGLCDYYWCINSTDYVFGVLLGGRVDLDTGAGAFCFSVNDYLSNAYVNIGFRPSLISAR